MYEYGKVIAAINTILLELHGSIASKLDRRLKGNSITLDVCYIAEKKQLPDNLTVYIDTITENVTFEEFLSSDELKDIVGKALDDVLAVLQLPKTECLDVELVLKQNSVKITLLLDGLGTTAQFKLKLDKKRNVRICQHMG